MRSLRFCAFMRSLRFCTFMRSLRFCAVTQEWFPRKSRVVQSSFSCSLLSLGLSKVRNTSAPITREFGSMSNPPHNRRPRGNYASPGPPHPAGSSETSRLDS
ncbi:hypothetical protein J4Q44_G00311940 [Coregonus suidteri]|uniref:Uncharacterized protein n=1 Tax=Coregonus suidteri TaxID=861788 RepID=A0AAN8KZI9_9TELE